MVTSIPYNHYYWGGGPPTGYIVRKHVFHIPWRQPRLNYHTIGMSRKIIMLPSSLSATQAP